MNMVIDGPTKEDLGWYKCENSDGSDEHELTDFECVAKAYFGCSLEDVEPGDVDTEVIVMWASCSCGHTTSFDY